MRLFVALLLPVLYACTPVSQSSVNPGSNPKILRLEDRAYEPQIRTIDIHPDFDAPEAFLTPAVTRLGDWNLVLEFDELHNRHDTYYARLIHCNFDWTKSDLMDLDFMTSFNEFPVNQYEYSVDTHIPYIHYRLNLPPVKLPGNYVVAVYRGSDKEDIILTQRFMVYDNRVRVAGENNLVGAGTTARLNQQLNFTVDYKNLDILNPLENLKVSIRQNQRWDNISPDVRPSFVREIEKEVEYRFFDAEKMFKGGNEFRFFDMRSLNHPGRNVARVDRTTRPFQVFVEPDKPRTDEVYGQYPDLNGGFTIENLDYNDIAFTNYANVHFQLRSPAPLPGKVYVTGAFSHWRRDTENRMTYDSTRGVYAAELVLKQGWYDYQYYFEAEDRPPYFLEGSHFETENLYEIFIYYRPFQPRADLLIGYVRLEKNER